jgi:glucans biosynthesis protein
MDGYSHRPAAQPGATWRLGVLLGFALATSATPVAGFDLEDVTAHATVLAQRPYDDAERRIPQWLADITYDQWRDIRFRPERALWRDRRLPFQVQFFHPGLYYPRSVRINVIDAAGVHPIDFSTKLFDYGKTRFARKLPRDLSYAGFRLHHPIKTPAYHDEVIVFLGASYFRAIGRDHVYGLSARGIAIDTVNGAGEEFPEFREFWLVEPSAHAADLTVFALLDGPSVTGAYRFVVRPGEQTVVDVAARLFLRKPVARFGIAPLTSMFFHGENSIVRFQDYRPEVHDSDGLLLHFDTGEWLWRPLDNPLAIHVSAFQMRHPRGFGLVQRDRDFASYQDLETNQERRPSVWIEPGGEWGEGAVELVELPTNKDILDNVVTYWVPQAAPAPGARADFAYTMHWYSDDPMRPPGARVAATRRDNGTLPDGHRFVIDFVGPGLAAIPPGKAPRGVVSVGAGPGRAQILDQHEVANPAIGGWRLAFQVRPQDREPIELRAFLEYEGHAISETWSYVLRP